MRLRVTVSTNRFTDLPWPDGIPIPAAGDTVTLKTAEETLVFEVTHRAFTVGTDPRDGFALTHVAIAGRHLVDPEHESRF